MHGDVTRIRVDQSMRAEQEKAIVRESNDNEHYTAHSMTVFSNNQFVGSGADIVAIQNANVQNVGGTVDLQSQAVCNGADISTDPSDVNVKSNQVCDATDPYADLNANVSNVNNSVALGSTAVGNSFSEDTNAPNTNIVTRQTNNSFEDAVVNSTVSNVNGNVSVSASAIGNNAQIIHY